MHLHLPLVEHCARRFRHRGGVSLVVAAPTLRLADHPGQGAEPDQEERHLSHFDRMMAQRGVRPTVLQPFWHVAGHALGAATALMSPSAAMACTAAVEDEIDSHYSEQLAALGQEEPELAATIAEFQADERDHRDTAIAAGAEDSFGYPLLYAAIRTGCRVAIELSKRI